MDRPPSFLAAVRDGYQAAGLEATAAPLFTMLVPRGVSPPHVVMNYESLGLAPGFEPTPDGQVDELRLVFACRASHGAAAARVAKALDAWMLADGGRRFAWQGGDTGPAFREGQHESKEPGRDRHGRPVWLVEITYRLTSWGKP